MDTIGMCMCMYLVGLNAYGGILVGFVVKYADNILRNFATKRIIITCIASILLFDFRLTIQSGVVTLVVFAATFLYSYKPKPIKDRANKVDVEEGHGNETEAAENLMNVI